MTIEPNIFMAIVVGVFSAWTYHMISSVLDPFMDSRNIKKGSFIYVFLSFLFMIFFILILFFLVIMVNKLSIF